jgi:general secretion pathway protein C
MLEWSHADLDRASRFGALGVSAVGALACLWFAVRLLWLMLGSGVGTASISTPVALSPQLAEPQVSVSKWHLFGSAAALRAEARNAPATQLRLALHGTLAEADPQQGMAMIADEAGVERAYRSGDAVPGGATLQEIYPDRVILQHEGVSETLNLPIDQASAPPNSVASAPQAAGTRAPGASGGNPIPGSTIPNNVLFTPPTPMGAIDYSKLQQQLGVDPASLARQVTALPVMVNGKMTGVRLTGGPEALVSKLGLKPDDIVTSVNGIPLDSPARLSQLLDNLKNTGRIDATIQRDGKPTTVSVNLK